MFTVPSNRSAGSATFSRAVPFAVYAAAFIVVVSAISLCLLLHEDDAVRRTSNRASDVNQISLSIDALDAKMSLRVSLVAVLPRHLLALDDAGWIRSRSNRARATVLRVAMSVRSAMEAIALHDSLKSATLRCSGDFHLITRGEDPNRHCVAEVVSRRFFSLRRVVEPEAAKNRRCSSESRFRCVTHDCFMRSLAAKNFLLAFRRRATKTLLA